MVLPSEQQRIRKIEFNSSFERKSKLNLKEKEIGKIQFFNLSSSQDLEHDSEQFFPQSLILFHPTRFNLYSSIWTWCCCFVGLVALPFSSTTVLVDVCFESTKMPHRDRRKKASNFPHASLTSHPKLLRRKHRANVAEAKRKWDRKNIFETFSIYFFSSAGAASHISCIKDTRERERVLARRQPCEKGANGNKNISHCDSETISHFLRISWSEMRFSPVSTFNFTRRTPRWVFKIETMTVSPPSRFTLALSKKNFLCECVPWTLFLKKLSSFPLCWARLAVSAELFHQIFLSCRKNVRGGRESNFSRVQSNFVKQNSC